VGGASRGRRAAGGRLRGLIVPIALLAGCAHALGPPDVAYGPAGTLPIVHPSNDVDRWYVPVETGAFGERLWFLDTGYSYTTCDDDFVAELGLELHGHVIVHGEAGDIDAQKARLPPFELGGHRVEGLVCLVRDLDSTSSIDDPQEVAVAGVIGSDVLREFRVRIDPAAAELVLLDPKELPPLRKDDPDVVPLHREYKVGLRVLAPVEIEGKPVRPVLDTGASGTHVDGARLGLEATHHQQNVAIRASGANGEVVRDLAFYRVSEVTLAGHAVGPVVLTDRPRPPWVPGLLGLDVLSRFEHEYDFRKGLARFTPIRAVASIPSYTEWKSTVATSEPAGGAGDDQPTAVSIEPDAP
jgi:hypothetical protein